MAIVSNYTTLQNLVGDYLARSDLYTYIPNFIQLWEERFYRDPRNWTSWMEAPLSVAITANLAPVPDDYLGLKAAYISGQFSAPLQRISLTQMLSRYPRASGSGCASYIARQGQNFIFGPMGSGTLVGTYYAKPDLLRTDVDGVNWLITNAPDLCVYGALIEAEPFLKNDNRVMLWKGMYDEAVAAYRSQFLEEDHLAPSMRAL